MPAFSLVVIAQDAAGALGRALASASFADEIVVVDGGSADATPAVARQAGARVVSRPFDDFSQQKNFANAQAGHDWVFSLDADETLGPELAAALRAWQGSGVPAALAGYRVERRSYFLGRWVRHSGWWPDRPIRLFDRRRTRWSGAVHERLQVQDPVAALAGYLEHRTYASRADQVRRMQRYAELWSREQRACGRRGSYLRLLLIPPLAFLGRYCARLGFLDGAAGWAIAAAQSYYVFQRERLLLSGD